MIGLIGVIIGFFKALIILQFVIALIATLSIVFILGILILSLKR